MARCGCSSDCPCAVRSGDCVRVVGSGTPTAPYVVSLIIDPAEDNIIECGPDGIVAVLPEPAVYTESTDCIDVAGDGTAVDPIRASPILDTVNFGNGLSCSINGLHSPVAGYRRIDGAGGPDGSPEEEALAGDFLLVDTDTGDTTVTLPVASTCAGEIVTIKKISASNDAILAADTGDDIDGDPDFTLSNQWASVTVVSVGIGWRVIASVNV